MLTQDLLPPDSGWQFLAFSVGVNDAGQIVGTGVRNVEESKGYLLTPIDIVPGDVDGDGDVDILDLLGLVAAWGECLSMCAADFDGSGTVDILDLLVLLANWS